MSQVKFVDRPPRIQPELPTGVVEIPAPPRSDEGQQPVWQAIVPIITIIGYLLIGLSGQGTNLAFILPMALAIFVSTGLTIYNAITTRRRRSEQEKAYAQRLIEMRREMVNAHNRQRTFYEYNYPNPEFVLEMRGDRRDNRGGSRLWERRTSDADFGVVRLGMGTRPSSVTYTVSERGAGEGGNSPQMQDAQRLAADSHYVTDVPLTLGLYRHITEKKAKKGDKKASEGGDDDAPPPIVRANPHAVGISGSLDDVYQFTQNMIAHFAAFHSPSDAMVYVLGMHDAAPHWSWAYALPHSILNPSKGQYRMYFEDRERVFAPVSGIVRELAIKTKDVVKVGQPLMVIQDELTGASHTVTSPIAARVQEFGRVVSAEGALKLIDVGQRVERGSLLLRFEEFELAMQQLEEELDPRHPSQREFGKKRNREVAGVSRFWKEKLWVELDRRSRRLRDRDENDTTNVSLPFMLIVVDLMAARPDLPDERNPMKQSWLDDLESEAAMSLLMGQGAALGAAVLFLVPQRSKIPSGCQGVIELKRDPDGILKFLYAETGLNTVRYVGSADTVNDKDTLTTFAQHLAEWEVRRSYGADIPRSVGLLQLYQADTIDGVDIRKRWDESVEPKRAEWPKIPLAIMAGQERRWLHFFADADGVHGMIAGSTGSGKSELLMTMILSLAVKYDPSAVNFVLIDFKGGAAFEPFKGLPHVVDIVTNLGPNAVARMFAAINAELNRRQRINQDNDVKDIVRYRKAGLHLDRRDNYPHLFIIIDEFAEMIANNPEYKAQLDSITRLGRALGVSLILAAQRPTGVTDQMRANIKFRICLRVETREESSELLRLPDASYLPSIPGRGYLQVGSESLELIQVGYTGESYTRADYSPLERYENRPIVWEADLGREEDEPMYDVLVRRMIKMADKKYANKDERPWRKPWPSPLPTYLALDQTEGIEVDYLVDDDYDFISEVLEDNQPFSLAPEINQWLKGRDKWSPLDWEHRAMRTVVGLMDDAASAKLRALKIDFMLGHYLVVGASGWGKSTFLRSVLTSLVASHAPDELHLYLIDFGNRSLQVFEDIPHTGAYIVTHEKERIERLMRKLEQIVDERKEIISAANVSNAAEYNQLEPRKRRGDAPPKLPAVLVVVDNFAEFKESYEAQLDVFASLVREGLANGLYFLITGEQSSAVGKLFNLLPERITLKLSDDGEYAAVVGRGARPVDEIAGRGLRRIERNVLEVQVAMPLGISMDDETKSENDRLLELLNIIKKAGEGYPRPPQVIEQEKLVNLRQVLHEVNDNPPAGIDCPYFVAGRSDYDLTPSIVALDQKLHFVISGQPSTGKTNALQTFILSLADRYKPDEAVIVMVDYQGGLSDYGGTYRLDDLPNVPDKRVINEQAQLVELVEHLENEFIHTPQRPPRDIFVFMDTYEEMDELTAGAPMDVRKRLGDLARRYGKAGLHFIIAGMRQSLGSSDELIRPVSANRYGLAMDAETAESSPFYGTVPRSYTQSELPRGRGFIVVPGKVSPVQVAVPFKDPAFRVPFMDDWIGSILARGQRRAEWLPKSERVNGSAPSGDSGGAYAAAPSHSGSNGVAKLTSDQRARIIERMEQVKEAEAGSLAESLANFDDETLLTLIEVDAIDIADILN
jgi:DNA segregation ATPase FtsK/SpoIIIE-like protein